jgi:hypothetical protein
MRHVLQLAAALLSVFTVTGCATHMTVSSHVEHGLDLSHYQTFNWGPADALPTGDPRLDKNPFFNDRVQGAVEKGLRARGFQLTAIDTSADLLVHYHANISKRINVNHVGADGYCSQAVCPPEVVEYEAGTLLLDIVDARTNRLIWRGWAQNSVEDMLNNPERMAKTIDDAVERMVLRLPPKL